MKPIHRIVHSRFSVLAALAAIAVETACLLAHGQSRQAYCERVGSIAMAQRFDDEHGCHADDENDESPEEFEAALERHTTVMVETSHGSMRFPDDDSLVAYFWRLYKSSSNVLNSAENQCVMNSASGLRWRSLNWMMQAMLAELHLIYADDPQFISKMEKSQSSWDMYFKSQMEMRFPRDGEGMGSSYPMVYHLTAGSMCMDRISELMEWYMGVDSREGYSIGLGSLRYDGIIAQRKETLHKEGSLPLKPSDIGLDAIEDNDFLGSLTEYYQALNSEVAADLARIASRKYKGTRPMEGKNWIVPVYGIEMVWIRPGSFTMFAPETWDNYEFDDKPQLVNIKQGYWLGKYEVTRGQWIRVMGLNDQPSEEGDDYPAYCTWNGNAKEFCIKLTAIEREAGLLPAGYEYALPDEAQWEYACRAGTTGAFAGDGVLDDVGWYAGNSDLKVHPVGKKSPNAWGLYDMHGNLQEWCDNALGGFRVRRGGSCYDGAICCQSAFRYTVVGDCDDDSGFRIALKKTTESIGQH